MKDYYNTTHETGTDLKTRRGKAVGLQSRILELFKQHPTKNFTPFEMQKLDNYNKPITSVRRAITNLTKAVLLEKTDIKREGDYGAPNFTWRLQRDLVCGQMEIF